MLFKRLGGALVAAALLGTVGIAATAPQAKAEGTAVAQVSDAATTAVASPQARAAWSTQSQTLCSNTSVCGISIGAMTLLNGLEENKAFKVIVDGQPGKTVPIRVFAVRWLDEKNYDFVAISPAVNVTPKKASAGSTYGTATVSVTVPTPPAGVNGGEIFIQTADFTKGAAMVGTRVDSESSSPQKGWSVRTSRGRDMGFSETQFGSDGLFHRRVDAAVPGHRYSVQLLRAGKWVTIDSSGPVAVGSQGTTSVQARLPKGLPTGKYRTRIVNVTKGLSDLSPNLAYTYFTWSNTAPKPTDPDFNVYTTPGTWNYNGRVWRTKCEPYSTTERCRTEIYATQITHKAGKFTKKTDFVFNNLTYKPSARSVWSKNPLGGYAQVGFNKAWTGEDGRKWRTECDTAASGRNGCRSYIWATVAEPHGSGYRVVNKWLFNNIVQFG